MPTDPVQWMDALHRVKMTSSSSAALLRGSAPTAAAAASLLTADHQNAAADTAAAAAVSRTLWTPPRPGPTTRPGSWRPWSSLHFRSCARSTFGR